MMMKKRRIIFILYICLGLLLTAGCEKQKTGNDPVKKTVTETPSEKEQTAVPTESPTVLESAKDSPTNAPAETKTAGFRKLQVQNGRLTDENGNLVQLRGISTHGLAWYPDYVNES